MTSRTLTLRASTYPVVLPSTRDPRLHVAAVIITIHVLGQVGLGFAVSIPQIVAAILSCAVIEVTLTFRQRRSIVWPASAMLTGSGVALILRVVGTPPNEPWDVDGWYVFAGVAAFSLLTKYVIKYRGTHVFNPSNVGLVVAFVVLGSTRVEPLDFWWGPLDIWMIAAYAVIITGGLLITRRLHLLALAGTFWIALAVGTAVLAGSGHCMTTNWAFGPVCGLDFWRVIVTSPEVLIFLFFMITDPKTTPSGQIGRIVFGLLVAVASVFLMAPQTNEFGTKVGLLAGLVVVCAVRPLLDRVLPEPSSAADHLGRFAARVATGNGTTGGLPRGSARVLATCLVVLGIGAGIVAAGSPARGFAGPDMTEVLDRVPHRVDPSTFPAITVDQDVIDYDHEMAGAGAQELVKTLAENLEIERLALIDRDENVLVAVDHGDRLDDMRARIGAAAADGPIDIGRYRIDTVRMSLLVPFGRQDGLSMGLDSRGTLIREAYDVGGRLLAQESSPFALQFVMRQATGGRWLTVAVLPPAFDEEDQGDGP